MSIIISTSHGSLMHWRAVYIKRVPHRSVRTDVAAHWQAHLGISTRYGADGYPEVTGHLSRWRKRDLRFRIPLPRIKWYWGYRARRVGGIKLYQWTYRFYKWIGPTPSYSRKGE
jgi:hypothetical protein